MKEYYKYTPLGEKIMELMKKLEKDAIDNYKKKLVEEVRTSFYYCNKCGKKLIDVDDMLKIIYEKGE